MRENVVGGENNKLFKKNIKKFPMKIFKMHWVLPIIGWGWETKRNSDQTLGHQKEDVISQASISQRKQAKEMAKLKKTIDFFETTFYKLHSKHTLSTKKSELFCSFFENKVRPLLAH